MEAREIAVPLTALSCVGLIVVLAELGLKAAAWFPYVVFSLSAASVALGVIGWIVAFSAPNLDGRAWVWYIAATVVPLGFVVWMLAGVTHLS